MDQIIYDLIVDKIDSVKSELKEDIGEIKTNVNELLKFKWKIAGMAMVVGIVSGAVFELVVRVFFKA